MADAGSPPARHHRRSQGESTEGSFGVCLCRDDAGVSLHNKGIRRGVNREGRHM